MILTNQGSQYYYGKKYNQKQRFKSVVYLNDNNEEQIIQEQVDFELFKYEILTNPQKSYGQIINNLICTQGRLTIKTNYNLNWKVKEYVVDNYNNRYIIEDIQIMPQEINPQVVAVSLINPDTDFILSLVKIDNAWSK